MRLITAVAMLALLALTPSPADASCAPPAPLAENAARAVAVVYGRVTAEGSGSVTLRIDRVLKGTVTSPLTVFLGPTRPSPGGPMSFTSVDYRAERGTDHVLYLIRGADGQVETNACIGSHAGPPTDEESAFYGAAVSPAAGTQAPQSQVTPAPQAATEAPIAPGAAPAFVGSAWQALLALALLGAVLLFIGRRVLLRKS